MMVEVTAGCASVKAIAMCVSEMLALSATRHQLLDQVELPLDLATRLVVERREPVGTLRSTNRP